MKNKIMNFFKDEYYLDVDSIINWVLSSSDGQLKETEINEGYDTNEDGDIQMVSKVIRESKTNNTQNDTIRYDFVKLLLSPIFNGDFENNGKYNILLNTLQKKGFLIKK